MINEYTGKLVTNGLMDQNGRYGAIDPARQSAYDPALAHLSPDLFNFCLPEFRHAPIASKAANMACKIGDQLAPIGCVDHLRSEQHTFELRSLIRISSAVSCLTQKIYP